MERTFFRLVLPHYSPEEWFVEETSGEAALHRVTEGLTDSDGQVEPILIGELGFDPRTMAQTGGPRSGAEEIRSVPFEAPAYSVYVKLIG